MCGIAVAAGPLTPQDFVAKASAAGMAEVQSGQVAVQKAGSSQVRTYGQMMVDDHGKANKELETLARSKGLQLAPGPTDAQKATLEKLKGRSGTDFDASYAHQMVLDHEDAVSLFAQAAKLQDAALAGFASRTLPTLQHHLEEARKLEKAR
jgi:putative membrane protein